MSTEIIKYSHTLQNGCLCVCLYYTCVCVCSMHVCAHTLAHEYTCRSQRLISDVFLHCSTHYFFLRRLLIRAGPSLASKLANPFVSTPLHWGYRCLSPHSTFYAGARDPNSDPHACAESILWTARIILGSMMIAFEA